MAKKQIPLGLSDFKAIIEKNYYYIDKTSLIEDLIKKGSFIALFCRPRRFGKTLSLSMLKYFFEKTEESHAYLFKNLAIKNNEYAQKEQGHYPVIFLSFKDIKDETFSDAYVNITGLLSKEFERHQASLDPILSDYARSKYLSIINKTADFALYKESVLFLSELLHKKYNKKVIILIDEYDTPIHSAYSYNYYDKMVNFIKILFSKALKDNSSLERGVMTGILRTTKEGIFSDLNNLSVYSMLSNNYTDTFGFTQKETHDLLDYYDLLDQSEDIKKWYNGYHMGDNKALYNPWSLLSFIENKGSFQPYWVNTSSNFLIKELLAKADSSAKLELELLLKDSFLEKKIEESFTFQNVATNSDILWSLLLFSGYLTYSKRILQDSGEYSCELVIPNHEIRTLYKKLIESIFNESFKNTDNVKIFFKALISGDVSVVTELLELFMLTNASYYDFTQEEPEKSYHLFVLGLLLSLEQTYVVKSNRESGYGRYDIMLIPKDKAQVGILIEFKKAGKKSLKIAARDALDQIKEKRYALELKNFGITNYIAYGIVFKGKELFIQKETSYIM